MKSWLKRGNKDTAARSSGGAANYTPRMNPNQGNIPPSNFNKLSHRFDAPMTSSIADAAITVTTRVSPIEPGTVVAFAILISDPGFESP